MHISFGRQPFLAKTLKEMSSLGYDMDKETAEKQLLSACSPPLMVATGASIVQTKKQSGEGKAEEG